MQAPAAPGTAAAFAALRDLEFPFRIGELGRSDDAVLGFFVDDDYTRFHIVDKVVASTAPQSGRHLGHLGLLGAAPVVDPIDHPSSCRRTRSPSAPARSAP